MAAPVSVFIGIGYGLNFDGINDSASRTVANFRSGDSLGTIEGWFRSSSTASVQTIFASADVNTSGVYFRFVLLGTSGKLRVQWRSGATYHTVDTDLSGYNDGKWHHYALRSSGTAWSIAIEGVESDLTVVEGSNSGNWFADTPSRDNITFAVLDYSSGLTEYFNGDIGFSRIYSREMAIAEALTNYQRGRKAAPSDTTGLVASWDFTEGTGTTAADPIGGYDLTITGATWYDKVKIRNSQINIDDRIGERSVANFTVVDTPGTASYDRAQPVSIYDDDRATATGTPIFSGFIDTPDSIVLSPSGALLHDIACIDNHYLADKRIAAKVWENLTSASMVNELITEYLSAEGISPGTIQTGDTLTRVVANYVPVSDAMDSLAEVNGFIWYIDSDKALHFLDRTTNVASFPLTASNVLNSPTPRKNKGNQQYRNIQWIRGGTDTTSQTENFLGDGVMEAFTIGFPINSEPTITENGASQTVGIRGVETGKDYYWNKGDFVVLAENAPSSNASVQVQYVGRYKTITMVRDDLAVASQQTIEGIGTGQVENSIINTDIDSRNQAEEFGLAKLTQWAKDAEKFYFSTRTAGLKAGQLLTVTFSPFSYTTHDMLVESVQTTANDEELRYNVTAVTGPVMGSWARFFQGFRRDPIISLGEDEQIILLRQQKETLPLTETATTYTDSISGNVVGRWLNSVPIDRGSLDHVQHEVMTFFDMQTAGQQNTASYTWN